MLHNVRVNREEHHEVTKHEENPGVEYMDIYMLVESIDKLEEMKKIKVVG